MAWLTPGRPGRHPVYRFADKKRGRPGANRENGENRTLRGQLHRLALPIGMGTDQQIAFRTDHGELMRKGVVTVD